MAEPVGSISVVSLRSSYLDDVTLVVSHAGVLFANSQIPQQTFRMANPYAIPFALECRRMNIVV